MGGVDFDRLAGDIAASFGTARTLSRPTSLFPGFSAEDGYRVAHLVRDLRVARRERCTGRKIGGTNRAFYHLTGATGPAWGFMYDTTARDIGGTEGDYAVGAFPLSRIEPEIAFRMGRAPQPGMSEDDLLGCIEAVAHGFEFVFSPFGSWNAPPMDAVAVFCLHQGFVAGPWHAIGADRAAWAKMLRSFEIELKGSNGEVRRGAGADVFDSPVLALKAVVDELGEHPDWTPIAADEIVTTGTITELMPAVAGETWTTTISGAPLEGLTVRLR